MLIATFVSFVSFMLIVSHAPPRWLRRMVGYKAIVDIVLHVTILWMFFGSELVDYYRNLMLPPPAPY